MKLEVYTVDPHVIRLRPSSTVVFGFAYGSSRKASIKEFHQLVTLTVTTPLRMTISTDCHFPNPVIPTEKPTGFDEESRVGTLQPSGTRSTHCRSSRRSFYSLLRMTGFEDFEFITYVSTPLRMTSLMDYSKLRHSDRASGTSDEESQVGTTKLSITRITYHSKLRSFHSLFDSLIKAIFLSLR